MPTLRLPGLGVAVMTGGSVMYGPPSSGQQFRTGSRSSDAVAGQHDFLAGACHRFATPTRTDESQQSRDLVAERSAADRWMRSSSGPSLRASSSRASTPSAHAMRRTEPNSVDHHRMGYRGHRRIGTCSNSSAMPPRLRDAIGDLGDLEMRVHRRADTMQLSSLFQQSDEVTQVAESHLLDKRSIQGSIVVDLGAAAA